MTDSDAGVYPPNVHGAYYRALFESLPYGVCRTDEHGTVQEANQALLTMMACNSVIEVAASDLTKKIIEDANERARVFESESESEKAYTELDWVRKDGVALRVRVSGRLARDEEGTNCGYLLVVENRNEQRAIEAQLRSVAQTDALTGLQNYRSLQDALETEIRRSARTGREFSLLLLDLDGMKEINDSFGHMKGIGRFAA